MKKIFFLFLTLSFLVGCQSAKDALTLKKKNSSDEFLVEKKSPLVLPPSYGKLPLPDNAQVNSEKLKTNDIQSSLSKEKLIPKQTDNDSEISSIEELILKKIK